MAQPFDPNERPRPSRQRAAKRRVADIGERPDFAELKDQPLDQHQIATLLTLLPTSQPDMLREQLQDLALSYEGWLNQPNEAEGEISHQLKMVAHLCRMIVSEPDREIAAATELAALVINLTDRTSDLIAIALGPPWKPFTWFAGESLPPYDQLEAAALSALERPRKQRDYANIHLDCLIDQLCELYVEHSGRPVTWSERPVGPATAGGNLEMAPGSPCGKFIDAFVRFVDPALPSSSAHNCLREIARMRRLKR